MGKRILWLMLVLLCACALAAFALADEAPAQADAPAAEAARVFTEEEFQTPAQNEPGKAWLALSIEPFEQKMDGKAYQMYNCHMDETNGIGFSIETIAACTFGDGEPRSQVLTAEQLQEFGMNLVLEPNGSFVLMGGFPKEAYDRMGIEVTGTDANGEALTFTHWHVFGNAE
ncbi:MAG: hypothetical protein IKQ80_01045 [Clostridia bacterium]|nr:hypothetical protein [Clostridia bacterium]